MSALLRRLMGGGGTSASSTRVESKEDSEDVFVAAAAAVPTVPVIDDSVVTHTSLFSGSRVSSVVPPPVIHEYANINDPFLCQIRRLLLALRGKMDDSFAEAQPEVEPRQANATRRIDVTAAKEPIVSVKKEPGVVAAAAAATSSSSAIQLDFDVERDLDDIQKQLNDDPDVMIIDAYTIREWMPSRGPRAFNWGHLLEVDAHNKVKRRALTDDEDAVELYIKQRCNFPVLNALFVLQNKRKYCNLRLVDIARSVHLTRQFVELVAVTRDVVKAYPIAEAMRDDDVRMIYAWFDTQKSIANDAAPAFSYHARSALPTQSLVMGAPTPLPLMAFDWLAQLRAAVAEDLKNTQRRTPPAMTQEQFEGCCIKAANRLGWMCVWQKLLQTFDTKFHSRTELVRLMSIQWIRGHMSFDRKQRIVLDREEEHIVRWLYAFAQKGCSCAN